MQISLRRFQNIPQNCLLHKHFFNVIKVWSLHKFNVLSKISVTVHQWCKTEPAGTARASPATHDRWRGRYCAHTWRVTRSTQLLRFRFTSKKARGLPAGCFISLQCITKNRKLFSITHDAIYRLKRRCLNTCNKNSLGYLINVNPLYASYALT